MHPSERIASERAASLAEAVCRVVIAAGEAAYEDAGIQGLCAEGRWEAAVAAMRAAQLDGIARDHAAAAGPHPAATDETRPSRL